MTKQGFDQLKRHEGLLLKPKPDTAGKLTIGYGRNLDDVGITEAEAEDLFYNDVTTAVARLDKHLPWWRSLNLARQAVLTNMMFNMGWGDGLRGLSSFSDTLSALKAGDFETAATEMLKSKWAREVGHRAIELSIQMRTGEYE